MIQALSQMLIDLPVAWDLIARITALLIIAWFLHGMVARLNARWRVHLWRFSSVAVIAVVLTAFLPRISVRLGAPQAKPAMTASHFSSGSDRPDAPAGEMMPGILESPFASSIGEGAEDSDSVSESTQTDHQTVSFTSWLVRSWEQVLIACWGMGVCLLAGWWVAAQVRIRVLLSKSDSASECCHRLLRQVASQLELSRTVQVRVSQQIGVPFVAGWYRPTVVLPARMAKPDYVRELPAIFAHELTHVRSHDLVWMAIAQWISIPLWFHPLTWRIRSAHAMACEEVADAVAADTIGNKASYSRTLARVALASVNHPPALAAISMARSPEILSRLAQLKRGFSSSPLTRRHIALAAILGVFALLPLASIKFGYSELQAALDQNISDTESQPVHGERVLEFPVDRSVGTLYIATEKEDELWDRYYKRFDYRRDWNWKYLGRAQGKVNIPAKAHVQLTLKPDGAKEMSWTAGLRPDDLYELIVFPYPTSADVYKFGDQQMRHIGHLTGLINLELMYVDVTSDGLQHLESMTSLEKLRLYSPELGNEGLKSIGKLTSLQVLLLSKMKWDDAGLLHLVNLKSLEEISLPHPGQPGKGFEAIVQLPKLKYIAGYTFTGEHLAHLQGATALRALCLDSNPFITDDGLKSLAVIPQLEFLDLFHTNTTDAGVTHLKPLKSLKRINLNVNRSGKTPALTVASATVLSQLPMLEYLDLTSVGGADEFLKQISSLKNLQSLSVGGHRTAGFITNSGLKHLTRLKNLERLGLSATNLSDEAGDSLAQLSRLMYLDLDTSNMTDAGVAKLSQLKSLYYLNLGSASRKHQLLTYSGISNLNGLTNLVELWYGSRSSTANEKPLDLWGLPKLEKLSLTNLRDQDLAGLAKCRGLKWLQTNKADITDAGLSHLAGLTSMERLMLQGTRINDAGLAHLEGMDKLHDLTIQGDLTDEGLHHLEKLKSLGTLQLATRKQFSDDALTQLRQNLPNVYRYSIDQDRAATEVDRRVLKPGQFAPSFNLSTLEGKELNSKSLRGKVVLLYFWSTTCSPCVASMPQTKESYQQLSKYDDFVMVGLSGDTDEPKLRHFVTEKKLNWPQVRIGSDSKIAAAYGVGGYPSYVLIGRDGKILCTGKNRLDEALHNALAPNEPIDK